MYSSTLRLTIVTAKSSFWTFWGVSSSVCVEFHPHSRRRGRPCTRAGGFYSVPPIQSIGTHACQVKSNIPRIPFPAAPCAPRSYVRFSSGSPMNLSIIPEQFISSCSRSPCRACPMSHVCAWLVKRFYTYVRIRSGDLYAHHSFTS